MATQEIKSTQWTCEGCETTVLVAQNAPKPDGFHFPIVEVVTKGERVSFGPVWAHKPNCIRKSLETAYGEALLALATSADAVQEEASRG